MLLMFLHPSIVGGGGPRFRAYCPLHVHMYAAQDMDKEWTMVYLFS
jgi:hypothetical protein